MNFTPGNMFASLFIGSIGAALFIYGKKQERIPQLTAGVVLSIFPMFVASIAWMIVIAIAIIVGLTMIVRAGH